MKIKDFITKKIQDLPKIRSKEDLKKLMTKKNIVYSIVFLAAIAFFIFVAFKRPNFYTLANFQNIMLMTSSTAVMAFGMTYVMVAGGCDNGMPMVMLLSTVLCGMLIRDTGKIGLGILILFLTGFVCGTLNGFFVSRMNLLPFITTLVMQYVCNGTAILLAQSKTITLPKFFININQNILGIIPVPVFIMIAVGIVMNFGMSKTVLGRSLRAIGVCKEAADTCGINTRRMIQLSYMIAGFTTSIAGIIMMSRIGSVSLMMVTDSTSLDVTCAAIVGGASIYGGVGTMKGAFLGALLISVIQNFINLFGLDTFTMYLIKGCIFLLCTYLDMIKTKERIKG